MAVAERLTAEELARWRSNAAFCGDDEQVYLLDEIEALRAERDAAVARETELLNRLLDIRGCLNTIMAQTSDSWAKHRALLAATSVSITLHAWREAKEGRSDGGH